MGALGGVAVSYERGGHVLHSCTTLTSKLLHITVSTRGPALISLDSFSLDSLAVISLDSGDVDCRPPTQLYFSK